MALMEKYSDLFALANQIGLKNPDVKEDGGKLNVSGQTAYQLDANRLWDNIKTHDDWEHDPSSRPSTRSRRRCSASIPSWLGTPR